MNAGQVIARVKQQFGDEYNVIIYTQDVHNWIHEAQLDIIRKTKSNATTVTIPLASFPFVQPDSISITRVIIGDNVLQYKTHEEIDMLGMTKDFSGTSYYWWQDTKKAIHIWPAQTGSNPSVIVDFYSDPPFTTTDADVLSVPQVYHEDLVHYCLGRAHNKNRNRTMEMAEMELYDRNISLQRSEAQVPDVPIYKLPDPVDFD